jgi:hypothetical protein
MSNDDGYNDGYFQWNSQRYPLDFPIIEPITSLNDPVLETLCGFIKGIINHYVSPSFTYEAQQTKLTTADGVQYVGTGAVGDVLCFPLNPNTLQTTTLKFPLVSIYRTNSETLQFSLVKVMTISSFTINYILPPLTIQQYNRLYCFLEIIYKVIANCMSNGRDANYNNGELVFKECGLAFQTFSGVKYEPVVAEIPHGKETKQLFFPMMEMHFTAYEPKRPDYTNLLPISGFNVEISEIDSSEPNDPYHITDGYVNFS